MHPDLNSFKLSLHRGCRSRFLDIFKDYVRDLDSILLREDIFGFKICTIGHVGSSL